MRVQKFLLPLAAFLVIAWNVQAQNTPAPNEPFKLDVLSGPVMELESTVVDYGTVEKKSEPLRKVKFTNTGTAPLVIQSARGSCGCTVPKWPKEPILPGETGELEIRYDTTRPGAFNKKVTIVTNEGAQTHTITVKGNVVEEQESIPSSKPSILKSDG
ncbi:MAG TPA: DUF1573 domain-containing protein [Saprospiraceae bacterium]|nr:DUF1573 domain-containing protein [Saprospiraceae bacterium]